jgi:hypothetical protein
MINISKKNSILIVICFLSFIVPSVIDVSSSSTAEFDDLNILFISNNDADYVLASAVNQTLNLNSTIVNININQDLNKLFSTGKYFETYDAIILILNQLSSPFSISSITDLDSFISQGNLFGIISTQIWRFNTSFHTLMGLDIEMQGQKEYPMGNLSDSLEISITNDTLLKKPFSFSENSTLPLEGGVGLTQAISQSYQIAISTNPHGNTSLNAFEYNTGFIFALPISPIVVSPSLTGLSQLVSSITSSGLELLGSNEINPVNESTTNPDRILFLISNDELETGVMISLISIFLVTLAYFVSKVAIKPQTNFALPKDKTLLTYLLAPIIFFGQILYPPIVRRIDSYDVMENDYRSQILTILDEREFLHFRELKRELSIGTSSLRWHLQVLEDFRLIDRQVFGQYEIYYLIRRIPEPGFLELYFSIISGGGYRIAQAFSRVKAWELSTLADYLGQSKEAVRYHLKKLEQINLIHQIDTKYVLNSQKEPILRSALERRSKSN